MITEAASPSLKNSIAGDSKVSESVLTDILCMREIKYQSR